MFQISSSGNFTTGEVFLRVNFCCPSDLLKFKEYYLKFFILPKNLTIFTASPDPL